MLPKDNGEEQLKKLTLTSKKIQLSCHLSAISMGELGEIGWYLKLEAVADKTKNPNKKEKDKERIK